MASEKAIGKVTHYYTNIGVAIIELSNNINKGDTVRFKGHSSDFTQTVESIQVEHEQVETAGKGEVIGIKVDEHAREGDVVYRIKE